jgi:hypothetical protein
VITALDAAFEELNFRVSFVVRGFAQLNMFVAGVV